MIQYTFFSALTPRLFYENLRRATSSTIAAIIDATSDQESSDDDDVADQAYLPNDLSECKLI